MTAPFSIVANLSLVLQLLRDRPEAKAEHAAAFRVLLASLGGSPAHLQITDDGLVIDGTPVPPGVPGAAELHDLLAGPGIGEIAFPASVPAAQLLAVLRALAIPPGTRRSFTDVVDGLDLITRALIRVEPRKPAVDAPVSAARDFIPSDDVVGTIHGKAQVPGLTGGSGVPVNYQPARARGHLRALLDRLTADPDSADIGDLLNEIVGETDALAHADDWPALVRAVSVMLDAERRAATSGAGRAYGIALRRIFPRSVVEPVARLVTVADHRDVAIPILKRLGADATEVLLAQLAAAPQMAERRAYYAALQQMTEGTKLLVNMLTHDEWYVVRNVADLAGDLKLDEAVPELARQLQHYDERVRRSALLALAKIGTAGTIEPLRQALRDPAPAMRVLAARTLDGWRFRGLAMTLAVLAGEESDPEVQAEMFLALGRIGTPEALQALQRAAAPGGKFFGRKPQGGRLTAIAGLRAAGQSAATALQALLRDDDPEIRAAAQQALAALISP